MIIKSNTVGHPLPDPRKGLNMEGGINMNGNPLSGLPAPMEDNDAATWKAAKDYADSLHFFIGAFLPATGWSESAPYTQTVAAAGIVETDRPIWGVVYSENNAIAEKEAFALVDDLDTADGSITFTCFEEKPEADLTIQLEVNR